MFGVLRNKLSQAIEWRVVREVDREREVIKSLEKAITQTSMAHGERIAVLEELVQKLIQDSHAVKHQA
jgi:hypothetical protein